MHANIINGLILLAIIAAIVALYCSAYSRGVTDGTDSGYDGGKSAGAAEASTLIRTTRADAEQLRRLREVERKDHQHALEAIMLDCDQRIALFARRANPFTSANLQTLAAAAKQLELAAATYRGLQATDKARFAAQMQQLILSMAEQLRVALEHDGQPILPHLSGQPSLASAAA